MLLNHYVCEICPRLKPHSSFQNSTVSGFGCVPSSVSGPGPGLSLRQKTGDEDALRKALKWNKTTLLPRLLLDLTSDGHEEDTLVLICSVLSHVSIG